MRNDANKLLVVDPDAGNRQRFSRLLEQRGYAVEGAADAQEALSKISLHSYDLVLLDQLIADVAGATGAQDAAGMSGLDLLRLLRATHSPNELPVILVAGERQNQAVVAALDEGANDSVMKPLDLPSIHARIQAQLTRAQHERHLILADDLTGLECRTQFQRGLQEALAKRERAGPQGLGLAVFVLGLDGFKMLNDTYGHRVGDQLLQEVASRLRTVAGRNGQGQRLSLARTSGDEFAVAVPSAGSLAQLQSLAAAFLNAIERPIRCGDYQLAVTASLGIAAAAGRGDTPESLLRDADLAMCRAKALGKNRWQVFDPVQGEQRRLRAALATDLRHALERDELVLFYQPEIHLPTRQPVGFEALLRWRHPQRGLISPHDFIPLAEESGLIIPMGAWVLEQACRQLHDWQTRFPFTPPLSMNVNLSVKQLADPHLVQRVKDVLAATCIPPASLRLELTESSLIEEIPTARDILANLQALGIGLKLDDFGTGYSSLSYLHTLHFDSLKIDRSFMHRLTSDADSFAIVRTILELARSLHMNVVAEGIETEDQLRELIGLGCDTGQGYLFSRPVPAHAVQRILSNARRVAA